MKSTRFALLLLALFAPSTATADIITNLIGDVQFTPLGIDIASPRDAVNANGTLHVVGQESNGNWALQTVNLVSGAKSSLSTFFAIDGSTGAGNVGVVSATWLNDGRVVYVGDGDTGLTTGPTYWFAPSQPSSPSLTLSNPGILFRASPTGTLVGADTSVASVGTLTEPLVPLQGLSSGAARDITDDGRYIVGAGRFGKSRQPDINS